MARVNSNILFGVANFELHSGEELVLIRPIDDGLSQFEATWKRGNAVVSGNVASINLTFTPDEVEEYQFPKDVNGAVLFKSITVRYVGKSNDVVSRGDSLLLEDLWYDPEQLKCRCINMTGARSNTDGRVVIKYHELSRT